MRFHSAKGLRARRPGNENFALSTQFQLPFRFVSLQTRLRISTGFGRNAANSVLGLPAPRDGAISQAQSPGILPRPTTHSRILIALYELVFFTTKVWSEYSSDTP
jgi:hypothetical protein